MVAVCCGPLVRHSPSVVEVASAMGAKVLYGRGMPRPNSMAFFFWWLKLLLLWNRRCCTVAACRDPLVCRSFFGG